MKRKIDIKGKKQSIVFCDQHVISGLPEAPPALEPRYPMPGPGN